MRGGSNHALRRGRRGYLSGDGDDTKARAPTGEESPRLGAIVAQKEKRARGTAASSGDEPGRGCPSRGPDLTPAKSCRALIRMKQRELTRQHVNTRHGASGEDGPEGRLSFEKEGSILQLPGADAESAEFEKRESSR